MQTTMLLCRELQAALPSHGTFDVIMNLSGQVYRRHKNRRTIRTRIGRGEYFVKTHGPTSWLEILKHVLRGRWPVLTARTEWNAINRLEELHVPTIHAVGFGVRGRFPHRLESFLITKALDDMVHLSGLQPQLSMLPHCTRTRLIRRLNRQIALIARTLHRHGMNHRDFYLAHFMVRQHNWLNWKHGDELIVYLIDLHRMQIRRRPTPDRWVRKDLAALLFSVLDFRLSPREYLRFLSVYWGETWRDRWPESRRWRRRVIRRALSLYRSEHGTPPPLPASPASFA